MVQKKRKIINGRTYKLYRSYSTKENALNIASKLRNKGIYRNGYNYISYSVRVIKTKKVRPYQVWTFGLRKIKLR